MGKVAEELDNLYGKYELLKLAIKNGKKITQLFLEVMEEKSEPLVVTVKWFKLKISNR